MPMPMMDGQGNMAQMQNPYSSSMKNINAWGEPHIFASSVN